MQNPRRTLSTLTLAAALAAGLSHTARANPPPPPPQGTQGTEPAGAPVPGRGKAIVVSGILSRDKDCQLLRTPSGQVYVLIGRLSQATAGERIRVTGRRGGPWACRQGPSILVESVRVEALVPAPRQPGEPLPPTGNMVSHRVDQTDDAARPAKPKPPRR